MKILQKIRSLTGSKNGIRLISIIGAVIVWYSIRAATSNPILVSDIPLRIQPPPGWSVMDASAESVDVGFLGAQDELRFLNRELIKAIVDVRTHEETGTFTVPLTPANINAAGSARIDFIRPTTITLRLDREITKAVPVKVDMQNVLPDGYEIEGIVITPATVELSGPAQRLEALDSVATLPVDLDGRIRSINKRRLPLVASARMTGVDINPKNVTVDIRIIERTISEEFVDLPVLPLLPSGITLEAVIDPEIATVKVKGRPQRMNKLTADDLRIYVDAAQVEEGKSKKLPISAILPEGITLVSVKPAKASVKVQAP